MLILAPPLARDFRGHQGLGMSFTLEETPIQCRLWVHLENAMLASKVAHRVLLSLGIYITSG